MNKLTIIGNLTKDPELRSTQSGISVCSFTVAVNRRRRQGEEEQTDFFRVAAWRQLGENCAKWLIKGRKVCVVGPVSVSTYTGQDGKTYANLEVTAEDVEFLGGNEAQGAPQAAPQAAPQQHAQQTAMPIAGGFTAVETDELPF